LEQEERIDEIILDKAIENKNVEYLKKLLTENLESDQEIEIAYVPREDEIIIDVREEAEIKKKPLIVENIEILQIPFININSEFKKLDQTKTYLFYCEK
jgi:thiamine biosynthesis protein ThiI